MNLGIFLTLFLSFIGVLADVWIKKAGQGAGMLSWQFLLGEGLYIITAPVWYFAMQRLKLANIGVIYSASQIVMLAVAGFMFFGERLHTKEVVGIGFALASIVMLADVADG